MTVFWRYMTVLETSTNTEQLQAPQRSRPFLDLLLISFLILFYELACIRFFGAMVVFLTFFTNIILIASFLGMSIGCMVAARRRNFINWVLPLSFVSGALALAVFIAYE